MCIPPKSLVSSPPVYNSLPPRVVLTPMGKASFRNETLEKKGYRYSFSRKCDGRLVEIVYLKKDGSTGTLIGDIDTLFDVHYTGRVYTVVFKFIGDTSDASGDTVTLHKVDVSPKLFHMSGLSGDLLVRILDKVLSEVFGRKEEV